MRAWLGLGLGAVLIGAAYAADVIVSDAIQRGRATSDSSTALAAESIARVAVVVFVLALAWLVFRGPRSRLVGLAMAILGFYVGLVPPLSPAFLGNTDIPLPPLAWEVLSQSTEFTLWAATSVMALGIVELLRPTTATVGVGTAPALLGSRS